MGRSPCCDKVGLKKGPWTPEEDQKLLAYIRDHGHGSWRALPSRAGLERCGKSCRLRWTNYLRPDIKRGKFSIQEEQTIIQLHALLGNRWSAIATHLSKRTDNEIKNYWNTHLKKRLAKMGIDPVTHRPKKDSVLSTNDDNSQSKSAAAKLSHLAQWESARLEAEARLVRESKLRLHHGNRSNKTLVPSTGLESPSSTVLTFSDERRQQAITSIYLHEMVKEEGEHVDNDKWKNSSNPNNFTAIELQGNNNNNNNSLSSGLLFHDDDVSMMSISDHSSSARVSSTEENIESEGFTDLLLNSCGDQSLSDNSTSHNNGLDDSSNDEYYEDSKNYWNSILSLVDSSPSESPMF